MDPTRHGSAVRFYGSTRPLRIEEAVFPKVRERQVLVKMMAAGVCASDIHFYHRTETPARVPLTLGHEGAGVVEEVGEEVDSLKVGDAVSVHYVVSCGSCEYCLSGRENLCPSVKWMGFDLDGTYSDYMLLPAENALRIPRSIPFEQAAIIGCAVVTPFHAMRIGGVEPGSSVAIIGIGGVGIHAVQMARVFGADRVIAVDVNDSKLRLAREVGADVTVNAQATDVVQAVKEATSQKGPDYVFEFFGSVPTILDSLRMVGRGGRVILVGIYRGSLELDIKKLLYEEIQLRASMDHTRLDLTKAIELVAHGRVDLSKSVTHRIPLHEAPRGFDILENKVENPVRVVLIP